MEVLVIIAFVGALILLATLYDKYVYLPRVSKISKKHDKEVKKKYKSLGIKYEEPYKIQEEIDHIKVKISYISKLISKIKNKPENGPKKKNLKNQYEEYIKDLEGQREKAILLSKNNLAEICDNCGSLRSIPMQVGNFGVKRIKEWDPLLSPCYKCSLNIGYECTIEKEMQIVTDTINSYTGPLYSIELPKTHPSSVKYSYAKNNMRDFLMLKMDFYSVLESLPHKNE